MNRDRRLTGYLRGQTDNVEAPIGFELNNPWRVSVNYLLRRILLIQLDGETNFLGYTISRQLNLKSSKY